jgi:hypothetical protein
MVFKLSSCKFIFRDWVFFVLSLGRVESPLHVGLIVNWYGMVVGFDILGQFTNFLDYI